MKALVLFSFMIMAAVLQAVLPSWPLLGQAKPPILAAMVVYYALSRSPVEMFWAAMLAGLMQDGLGLIPFGYSSFSFCIMGGIVSRYKEMVFVHESLTHLLFGMVVAGGHTLILYLLLSSAGLLNLSFGQALHKTGGSALLGMLITPVIFQACAIVSEKLGLTVRSEAKWHEIF